MPRVMREKFDTHSKTWQPGGMTNLERENSQEQTGFDLVELTKPLRTNKFYEILVGYLEHDMRDEQGNPVAKPDLTRSIGMLKMRYNQLSADDLLTRKDLDTVLAFLADMQLIMHGQEFQKLAMPAVQSERGVVASGETLEQLGKDLERLSKTNDVAGIVLAKLSELIEDDSDVFTIHQALIGIIKVWFTEGSSKTPRNAGKQMEEAREVLQLVNKYLDR